MPHLAETLAALDRLRGDIAKVHAALVRHERSLAAGRRDSTMLNFMLSFTGSLACLGI